MRYAMDKLNNRIEVEYSGQKAKCDQCLSNVTGRKAFKTYLIGVI